MQETIMEDDLDKPHNFVDPYISIKPQRFLKFYVRRSLKFLNKSQDVDGFKIFEEGCCTSGNYEGSDQSKFLQAKDVLQDVYWKEEKNNSKEEFEEKCDELKIPQMVKDDSQFGNENAKKKYSTMAPKKQRFHRPRIMEDGRKQRNPATIRLRTISRKRKRKENNNEEEVIIEPGTPEKQSLPKRRKNEKIKKKVTQALTFDQETVFSCLELSRKSGPNFPKGKRRMTTRRRSIWKNKSKRSNRRKNVIGWSRIALSCEMLEETLTLEESHREDNYLSSQADTSMQIEARLDSQKNNSLSSLLDVPFQIKGTVMRSASCVTPKQHNKRSKDIAEHLIQQMNYQKVHNLSSLAEVPLHIEDTFMSSTNYVAPERPTKKAKDIFQLIKEMRRLKINRRVTTVIKSRQKKKDMQLVAAKVDLDSETIKEWELLMVNDLPSRSYADKETESKWKEERENFKRRIDLFINRMHLLQGNRKFKQWKGSVVDSVVGVFLTQNVSDYLSSNAFISVAAKFPVDTTKSVNSLEYYVEEPLEDNDYQETLEDNDSVFDDQEPTRIGNNDAMSSEYISLPEESIRKAEEYEKTTKRKNEKTGIMEEEQVDWEKIKRTYTKEGPRNKMHMDSVSWNDVRLSGQQVFANTIKKRGQFRILSGRILKFLNNEAKQNGIVDLEWLRDAPSDLVKRYLLEIEGIGLKSAECVRLLGLKHSAFPVDTNVGRIAIRLGWVPLEPLPDGVQMHQLYQYPSMDLIQKYLWPRLCKLPQEILYELHYQMITFGKVFCTKVIPNCNACPMKTECKYFASAYVSSKILLQGPEEKIDESDTFRPTYPYDVDANMTSSISLIEEDVSPECGDQTDCCEPVVEFPPSPIAGTPELIDIEDTFCTSPYQSFARVPEIDFDIDALKKNVEDAFLSSGKMLNRSVDEVSKALVVLTPENACIPIKPPRKMKYYNRLRTEHVVYMLPDNHELLHDFERREHDDPSPYLLAIWQPGETSYSFTPPKKKCNSDGSNLCKIKTCSYCWSIREQNSNTFRGTILIPCRTAMRGGFPLNGTYFQTNEVFADHETSLNPVVFPREWCDGLEKRALYCGSSVSSIFRFVDTKRIQLCFWTGFLCMRAFDRKHRNPEELVRRLHTQPDKRGEKHMEYYDE